MKLLRGTDAHGYIYSLSLGRMPDARGEVVTRQRLDSLASEATAALETNIEAAGGFAAQAVVGHATVARAVSIQSLIRQAQGRSSLLDAVAGRLSSSGFDQGPKSTGPSSKLTQATCLSTAGQAFLRPYVCLRTGCNDLPRGLVVDGVEKKGPRTLWGVEVVRTRIGATRRVTAGR